MKSLKRCSSEISQCFARAIKDFMKDKCMMDLFLNDIIINQASQEYDAIPAFKEYKFDEFVWDKFKIFYPSGFSDLEHAIQVALDNTITRKVYVREQFIAHFFMNKLRYFVLMLPGIHYDHISKIAPQKEQSLGPVPYEKLVRLKIKSISPENIDEFTRIVFYDY